MKMKRFIFIGNKREVKRRICAAWATSYQIQGGHSKHRYTAVCFNFYALQRLHIPQHSALGVYYSRLSSILGGKNT